MPRKFTKKNNNRYNKNMTGGKPTSYLYFSTKLKIYEISDTTIFYEASKIKTTSIENIHKIETYFKNMNFSVYCESVLLKDLMRFVSMCTMKNIVVTDIKSIGDIYCVNFLCPNELDSFV